MRKSILLSLFLALASMMYADDYTYPYLVFTNSQGSQTAIAVDGLEITISDGNLLATNAEGTTTLSLADLASMQFTETADMSTGIDELDTAELPVTVYSLSGIEVGTFDNLKMAQQRLQQGVYIAKQNGKTAKFCVR